MLFHLRYCCLTGFELEFSIILDIFEINNKTLCLWKKLTWGLTYFDQFILSMSSLQTTYHNIRAAKGFKSPHLESHEVLEKVFESNPQVKPMHKVIRQYMHMVGVLCLYISDEWTAI